MKQEQVNSDSAVTIDAPAPNVHRLTIRNERHRGALSAAVLDGLEQGIAQTPRHARCLLLTGTGDTFSAGYDLSALAVPPDPEHADRTIAPDSVALFSLIDRQPLPVVAAVNGPALGGGLELVLACDLRIAARSASLGAPAGRLGLVYSPVGIQRLMAELPFAIASSLFLGDARLSAERAHELGLFNQIVDSHLLERLSVELASRVASLAPLSVQSNRHALRELSRQGPGLSPADRERLLSARAEAMRSTDFAEGVRAFREHRTPRFIGS